MAGPVIRYLSNEQLFTPILARNILISVLQGLQVHGQHDTNQVLKNKLILNVILKVSKVMSYEFFKRIKTISKAKTKV